MKKRLPIHKGSRSLLKYFLILMIYIAVRYSNQISISPLQIMRFFETYVFTYLQGTLYLHL
jgi:hypothetical protein